MEADFRPCLSVENSKETFYIELAGANNIYQAHQSSQTKKNMKELVRSA